MDAVYRAAGDAPLGQSPPRVALSAKARRQRDKDSMRRARRKKYPTGLTSTLLDEWWSEVTQQTSGAPPPRSPVAAEDRTAGATVDAMSGEQAFGFFSRSGLPTGGCGCAPRRFPASCGEGAGGAALTRRGCPFVEKEQKEKAALTLPVALHEDAALILYS